MVDRAALIRLFEDSLDDDFEVLFASGAPPSRADVLAFGRTIDCQFPDDYLCLLTHDTNGFYAEAKEVVWRRVQGGRFWMLQYALITYGLNAGLPDWIELSHQVELFRRQTTTTLTPCMRTIGSSEPYCFDASGALVRWDHESAAANPVGTSFLAALEAELRTLRANKDRMATKR